MAMPHEGAEHVADAAALVTSTSVAPPRPSREGLATAGSRAILSGGREAAQVLAGLALRPEREGEAHDIATADGSQGLGGPRPALLHHGLLEADVRIGEAVEGVQEAVAAAAG